MVRAWQRRPVSKPCDLHSCSWRLVLVVGSGLRHADFPMYPGLPHSMMAAFPGQASRTRPRQKLYCFHVQTWLSHSATLLLPPQSLPRSREEDIDSNLWWKRGKILDHVGLEILLPPFLKSTIYHNCNVWGNIIILLRYKVL